MFDLRTRKPCIYLRWGWLTNSAILDTPVGDLRYSEPDISSPLKPCYRRKYKISKSSIWMQAKNKPGLARPLSQLYFKEWYEWRWVYMSDADPIEIQTSSFACLYPLHAVNFGKLQPSERSIKTNNDPTARTESLWPQKWQISLKGKWGQDSFSKYWKRG